MERPLRAGSPAQGGPRAAESCARETVAVVGSCLTRDNFNSRFNPGHDEFFEVCATSNQSSIIALMSPPIHDEFEPLRPMNDYDRWNIRVDLSREVLPRLAATQPDWLLLDFQGDVRFGVARLPDGRYFTDNLWKTRHTDFYARLEAAGALRLHHPLTQPDAYFALWTEALERFAAYVAENCPRTRVVVHRGHHAKRIVLPGRPRPVPVQGRQRFRGVDVDAGDAWWARLDDHAVARFGWDQIDLREVAAPTYPEHPWGAYFGHYTPDYYHRFLAELNRLSLRRRLDPDTMRRLELMEQAAVEPWQRRLSEEVAVARVRRRRLVRARARIAELERAQRPAAARVVDRAVRQALRSSARTRSGPATPEW